MKKIIAVIFDLDGVLIDATEWHYVALNRALTLFGFSILRHEHLSVFNGLPTRKKLEILSVEKGLPSGLHDLINRLKQVFTREEILTKCRPSFEKEYMISRLKREGYRLVVCSNAIRESVELMMQKAGLFEYFEFLLSNEDVVKSKPDPEIYSKAFNRLACKPEETIIVEDAPCGVQAARQAGGNVCVVTGFHDVHYARIRDAIDQAEKGGAG